MYTIRVCVHCVFYHSRGGGGGGEEGGGGGGGCTQSMIVLRIYLYPSGSLFLLFTPAPHALPLFVALPLFSNRINGCVS